MASTIILKNGTGSAEASSLTQGELAINVSNGKLFYGTSGSSNSVSSSFAFTDISASGTITADAITATLAAGTDNSVVVLNSSNQLVTDEAQAAIFGSDPIIVRATLGEEFTTVTEENPVGTANSTVHVNAVATGDDAAFFVAVLDGASGAQVVETTTKVKVNPSTGVIATGDTTLGAGVSTTDITSSRHISGSSISNIIIGGDITGSSAKFTNTKGIYTDKIRRSSDSDNTTKILLNDEVLKFHVSDSSNETLKIQESSSVFTGNITASGNINANTFKGVPIVLGRNSQMIAQPALGDFYYGNNSQGFFHHQHNAKLTSATPVGQTLGGGSQHNGFILPCDVKNVELRASCRTNIDNTGFSFWVLKNTRASKGSSNSALVFMASASISGSNVGTQDNRFHTCDISGSSHSYITNMTASEGEALFVILQIHDETGGDGGAAQSNTNTKFYYTLSARTNE
tara:strand:+ start:1588 stop:2964 length:1377 start_codon:yes stop_codon:yes gene_type:complete